MPAEECIVRYEFDKYLIFSYLKKQQYNANI